MRKVEDKDLLRRIAHAGRIVDHQGLPLKPFQQVRGRDVGQVERRVLPHQHDVHIGNQVDLAIFAAREVRAFDPLHRYRRRPGGQAPAVVRERLDLILIDRVTALLRCFDQGKAGIPGNLDAFQRVHLDRDA